MFVLVAGVVGAGEGETSRFLIGILRPGRGLVCWGRLGGAMAVAVLVAEVVVVGECIAVGDKQGMVVLVAGMGGGGMLAGVEHSGPVLGRRGVVRGYYGIHPGTLDS